MKILRKKGLKVKFTQEAEDNLNELFEYSTFFWGDQKTQKYINNIEYTIEELSEYPYLGRERKDIYPEIRSLIVGEHIIYYLVKRETVIIIGILHSKTDPGMSLRLTIKDFS